MGQPSSRTITSQDALNVGALLFLAVVVPLVVGAVAGTLDVPRNDDWSYRGIAGRLFSTGRLELDGAAETAVLGQVLATQPALWLSGGSWWAFLVFGMAAGTLTVLGGYALARRFLDPRSSVMALAALVFFPAYLAYAISYMTDVPALACQFLCLALAAVALGRDQVAGRWLTAALVVGCIGFSIREFALAAPAAVVAAIILREPTRFRTWIAIAGVGLAVGGVLLTRLLLPGQLGDVPWELQPPQALLPALVTLLFVLSPVAFVSAHRWRHLWHRLDVVVGLLLGGIAIAALVRVSLFPHVLLYDLITQWGSPSAEQLIGGRPKLVADEIWWAVGALASVSTVLVAGIVGGVVGAHLRRSAAEPALIRHRLGSPAGLLVIFVAAIAAGLTVFGLIGWLYDRYLWPAVPPLAVLLLYVPTTMQARRGTPASDVQFANETSTTDLPSYGLRGVTVLYSAILVVMSTGFLLNSNAFDGARWHAAEELAAMGFTRDTIDAGPAWVGTHQTGFATVVQPGEGLTWWQSHWPNFKLCALVASAPPDIPGQSLIKVDQGAYDLFLLVGPSEPFYYYRVVKPGCPDV